MQGRGWTRGAKVEIGRQEAITSARRWCLGLVCGSGDDVQGSDLGCIWRKEYKKLNIQIWPLGLGPS